MKVVGEEAQERLFRQREKCAKALRQETERKKAWLGQLNKRDVDSMRDVGKKKNFTF